MEFLASLDTYETDLAAQALWKQVSIHTNGKDGICYYKHPIIESATSISPDLAFICKGLEPVIVKIMNVTLIELENITDNYWKVKGEDIDSPIHELDDFVVSLSSKFDRQRILRRKLYPIAAIFFPHVTKSQFESIFNSIDDLISSTDNDIVFIWNDINLDEVLIEADNKLNDREWLAAKSVFQGVNPLTGSGKVMKSVRDEIEKVERDVPSLRFVYPDMNNIRIRRLDASETSRRKKLVGKAKQSLNTLLSVDKAALTDIDPELLKKLKKLLGEVSGESE